MAWFICFSWLVLCLLLEQRVHVQQVVLDGRAGHGPAGTSPQLTHGHGGLHFGVFDVVGFVQNHSGPGHSQKRSRVWWLIETVQKTTHNNFYPQALGWRVQFQHWGRCISFSHHVISLLDGFLSLLLLDRDLFWDQTVGGHHHIMICEPEGCPDNL